MAFCEIESEFDFGPVGNDDCCELHLHLNMYLLVFGSLCFSLFARGAFVRYHRATACVRKNIAKTASFFWRLIFSSRLRRERERASALVSNERQSTARGCCR